jgi:HEAT repeat protein
MDAVRRLDDVIDELVKIGDPRAVEPLIKASEKRDAFTSCSAITALGELGDKRAVKTLVKALGDDDEDVRDDAKKALKKLGHEVE